ncbi:hypothetical protein L1987_20978 [Smallanthus sonchifolius]|uniref:Uncharacterized protein n=1 Tax=Smallanthus sonchifolius TaxID=185202 RepID=A0ACB9ITC1_9ASTR|nr:hypothetical protein L1987_20978 [Smallanthus sonchifolius]
MGSLFQTLNQEPENSRKITKSETNRFAITRSKSIRGKERRKKRVSMQSFNQEHEADIRNKNTKQDDSYCLLITKSGMISRLSKNWTLLPVQETRKTLLKLQLRLDLPADLFDLPCCPNNTTSYGNNRTTGNSSRTTCSDQKLLLIDGYC